MKGHLFLLLALGFSTQLLAGTYQDLRDDIEDLRNDIFLNEMYRQTDRIIESSRGKQGTQNSVDAYMSKLYLENRNKSNQLGYPQSNPITDPGSWVRVPNKNSPTPWFIYKPSIQKVSGNEYAYWDLVDMGSGYKAIGYDVLIMSVASKQIINCSNRKYKYQAFIDFTGKHGTGDIVKVKVGEILDSHNEEPLEVKKIVCPLR